VALRSRAIQTCRTLGVPLRRSVELELDGTRTQEGETRVAMTKCKECSASISKQAKKCPKCGAPRKKTSVLAMGCLVLILLMVIGAIFDSDEPTAGSPGLADRGGSAAASQAASNGIGDTVAVGYTSYAVWKAWWSDRLTGNEFMNEPPNAAYLFVDLTVRNNDKKARTIPPFKLVDSRGAEYDTSANAWQVDNAFSILEDLNPDVSKQGVIVFDVPKKPGYKLKVDGGFWSSKSALIDLEL